MNEFNLDEYKKGIPALSREDEKWWFLAEIPNAESDTIIISHNGKGRVRTHTINGIFSPGHYSPADLVLMYHEPNKYYVNVYENYRYGVYLGNLYETLQEANEATEGDIEFIKTIEFDIIRPVNPV